MVLDPIPQCLPVHIFGSRPQPPTSRAWVMNAGKICVQQISNDYRQNADLVSFEISYQSSEEECLADAHVDARLDITTHTNRLLHTSKELIFEMFYQSSEESSQKNAHLDEADRFYENPLGFLECAFEKEKRKGGGHDALPTHLVLFEQLALKCVIYTHTHTRTHARKSTYEYTHICTHIHTHTHTHTH